MHLEPLKSEEIWVENDLRYENISVRIDLLIDKSVSVSPGWFKSWQVAPMSSPEVNYCLPSISCRCCFHLFLYLFTDLLLACICHSQLISPVSYFRSVGNAIHAFGNGTDVGVWQPMSPVQTTTSTTTPYQRNRERNPNTIDNNINTDPGIYHFCGSLQVRHTHAHTS